MTKDKKVVWLSIFSFAGFLFASYMSGVKFFTDTCAFGEACPYFLGYPACYYGFAMFLVLTISSYLLVTNRIGLMKGTAWTMWTSFLGILFAGYFTLRELPLLFSEGSSAYFFGLPTCALGLIFYILIFIMSLVIRKNR